MGQYMYRTNVLISPFPLANIGILWSTIKTNKSIVCITGILVTAFVTFMIGFPVSFNKIIQNSEKSYIATNTTRDDMKALIRSAAGSLGLFFLAAFARIYITYMKDANPVIEDKTSMALTLGLFTLLCSILYFQSDSLTRLLIVNSDYKVIISKLNTVVTEKLKIVNYEQVRASALEGQKTSTPTITQQICMYMAKNIKALHPEDDLDPNEKNLWPYIMHQTNSKELDAILNICEANC
jgi:hypothetical protein